MWFAKILSPVVLIPTAVFFTYKANKDSTVFNIDMYRNALMKLLGLRTKRHISMKEVVIEEPNYELDKQRLQKVTEDIVAYNKEHKLFLMPNVIKTFFIYRPDHEMERINEELEEIISDLENSKERDIIKLITQYPIISTKAHTRPFENKWGNILAFILFPLGTFLYLRMWRFRLRLLKDLRTIHGLNDRIIEKIDQ